MLLLFDESLMGVSFLFQVDGDGRNLLPTSAQDSLTTVAAHTALLSAANVGAGYTAFV